MMIGNENVHFHVSLDTFGGMLEDKPTIVLSFTDKESGEIDCYPLPMEMSEDLGNELIRLTKELTAFTSLFKKG